MHMSTPQQVRPTQTGVRTQNEFFGSKSEPGIGPVERTLVSAALHWQEHVMEGALLGLFMISACVFTVIFQLPGSPVRQAIASAELRRVLTGIAMGLTAIALIYSPWGQRSGAHLNPSVTLTFLRLGKIKRVDAKLLFSIPVRRRGDWCLCGRHDSGHSDRRCVCPICGDLSRDIRRGRGCPWRVRYLISADDDRSHRIESSRAQSAYRYRRRVDGGGIHCHRGSLFGYEHEPGTNVRISTAVRNLARIPDLSPGPTCRDAGGCAGIRVAQGQVGGALLQARSLSQTQLHFLRHERNNP